MKLPALSALVPFFLAASAFADDLVCDVRAIFPKPASTGCGRLVSPFNLNKMIDAPEVNSMESCAQKCMDNSEPCESFTWDGSNVCRLFSATARHMKVSRSMDGVTRFWNRKCFACQPRRFFLQTSSSNPALEALNIRLLATPVNAHPPNPYLGIVTGSATLFGIRKSGALATLDDSETNSYESYNPVDPSSPTTSFNFAYSFIQFMTDSGAASHAKNVPVHCSISATYKLNCWSDAGDTFYGCQRAGSPVVAVVLSRSDLQSASQIFDVNMCDPIQLNVLPENF